MAKARRGAIKIGAITMTLSPVRRYLSKKMKMAPTTNKTWYNVKFVAQFASRAQKQATELDKFLFTAHKYMKAHLTVRDLVFSLVAPGCSLHVGQAHGRSTVMCRMRRLAEISHTLTYVRIISHSEHG